MELDRVADGYLQHFRTKEDDLFPFFERACTLVDRFEEGYLLIKELLKRAEGEAELAYIGYGPIQDYLWRHTTKAIPRLLELGRQSERARAAFAAVELEQSEEGFEQWKEGLKSLNII